MTARGQGRRRGAESGIVLVYVLVVLAVASAVVVAMVGQSDRAIDRSRQFSDAAQAEALIRGGEASALAALARDGRSIDHGQEAWAQVAQQDLAIAGGRFQLRISDAQGLYNLTNLVSGGVLAQDRLRAIVASARLDPSVAVRLIAAFASGDPPREPGDLHGVIAGTDLAALAGLVTVLPAASVVNLNAAPSDLVAVMLANAVQARILMLRRDDTGFLTAADVAGMGVILPPGIGFASDFFRVEVTVQVGDALLATSGLIWRSQAGPVVVSRKNQPVAAGSGTGNDHPG